MVNNDEKSIVLSRVVILILILIFGSIGLLTTTNYSMTLFISGFMMFLVQGVLHMYFSHHSYVIGRSTQFIFAILCLFTMQQDPLVWASFHRRHHRYSDTEQDVHSPNTSSFFASFIGWAVVKKNCVYDTHYVNDWLVYPELVWLARHKFLIVCSFLTFFAVIYSLYLANFWGLSLEMQLLNSIKLLLAYYFAPVLITLVFSSLVNAISHLWGWQDFNSKDKSTNNFFMGLITLGAGWHNNHHAHPHFVNCGQKWWQVDISYYIIWLLHKIRVVKSMKVYVANE